MASDLISRSALIEEIHKIKFQVNHSEEVGHNRPFVDIANVLSCIDEQPTAYNVDAVVEELEKGKRPLKEAVVANSNCISITNEAIKMRNSDIDKYIAIVRKGGVNGK